MSNGGNGKERPYYPKDGHEGVAFMARRCDKCKRHQLYEQTRVMEDECLILHRSLMNKPGDILYPPEWITTGQGAEAGECTAYEPIG